MAKQIDDKKPNASLKELFFQDRVSKGIWNKNETYIFSIETCTKLVFFTFTM